MNKIEKTFKKLKDIPNLNCGGCLIAAYSVYKKVINNSNVRIVQLSNYSGDKNLQHNMAFVKGINKVATSAHHFGITMDNGKTIYDSTGIYTKYVDYYIIPRDKTHEFCKSAILKSSWNNTFDRKTYIPQIFKKLKITIKFLNK